MTKSEIVAYKYLKRKHNHDNCYISKIPDFKQTKNLKGGYPDYLVIDKGIHIWYEIKKIKQKNDKNKKITRSDFTPQQLTNFYKMLRGGANIIIITLSHNLKNIYEFDYAYLIDNKSIKLGGDKNAKT